MLSLFPLKWNFCEEYLGGFKCEKQNCSSDMPSYAVNLIFKSRLQFQTFNRIKPEQKPKGSWAKLITSRLVFSTNDKIYQDGSKKHSDIVA